MTATKFCCIVFSWLTACAILAAQAPSDVPPPPVFRSGIQLVQVSVVAEDERANPVTNLRREDFRILDNRSPQEIRLFVGPEKSGPFAPGPATPDTFTNRIAPSGSHGGYSAILIDSVFTDFGDPDAGPGSANARLYALRSLRSIPAGESVAIYAMDRTQLQVVSDFTSDRDLLRRRLDRWGPGVDTPATNVQVVDEANAEMRKSPGARRMIQTPEQGEARGSVVSLDALRRAEATSNEMDTLIGQLARVPGPKHLIWLSNHFVIGGQTLRKFSSANVAIYPVHLGGIAISCDSCTEANKASMDGIAALTGGIAYHDRNDIDVVIREAMEDGRVSYTLGFYQSGDDKTAPAHHVTVLAGRPGLTLRYRTIYQAEEAHAVTQADYADLARALSQSTDLTAIPVRASATRAQDRLSLKAVLDAAALELRPEGNLWKGKIEIVARFTAADGSPVGDLVSQTLTLNLRQPTYDAALERGISFEKVLQIPTKATQLKLLFANPAFGKIGTLTIPLSGLPFQQAP
jgi:VWFA-related protein